jgi:hypothetical protein
VIPATVLPHGEYVVWRSQYIATREEARQYYLQRLAGQHPLECYGKKVVVAFESAATHLYSVELDDSVCDESSVVRRRLAPGKIEERRFDVGRAILMDEVLPAISRFTVAVPGTGLRGMENRMLHGQRLVTGQYLRVVLRPGPRNVWTCVTAYPVTERVWRSTLAAKRAKFPP